MTAQLVPTHIGRPDGCQWALSAAAAYGEIFMAAVTSEYDKARRTRRWRMAG